MKGKVLFLLGTSAMAFFVSCVTSIPITVNHPPLMDTNGIERLVVRPFEGPGNRRQIAETLTFIFRDKISGTGVFRVVEYAGYRPNADMADAFLTGIVTGYTVEDGSHEEKRTQKTSDGQSAQVLVTVYDRKVTLEFTYRIVNDRDGTVIRNGERKVSCTASDSKESRAGLQSGPALARTAAEGALSGFNREVVPWTSRESLNLEKESSRDRALKARMKEADALVKAGSVKAAQEAYAQTYEETGSPAAGYNAAILAQPLYGLDAAISRMAALANATGYGKARTELARLERFRGENAAAAANQTGTSARNLAIKKAADGLTAVLPPGSRVSVLNISRAETDLGDVVIREITDALIAAGKITVLDRQNLQLIEAEKRYQASGEVSDDAYVSIGKMLGVETIVTVSITGSGSQRKLTTRSISVETGRVLYSDSTEI
ncbi:MAG: penicillin-binding protein activator LpoB [Spirochaetaceae bacterium]|nr:penicillin-binding protein activator LpoB [Spirochaetaceae bacterium]